MLEDHTIQLSRALSIPIQYVSVDQCCNFTCSGLREYAQLWYKIQAEHRHRWGREFTSSCSCSSRSLSSTTRYDPSSSNSQPSLPYSWIIETLSTELIVVFLSPQSNTCQQRKEIPQLNRHSLFQNFKNQLSSSRNIKKKVSTLLNSSTPNWIKKMLNQLSLSRRTKSR